MRSRSRHSRGFTLIELMYASGYFMVALTGIVCFQVVAARGSGQASDNSMASNLASSTLEELHTRSPAYLQSAGTGTGMYDRSGNAVTASPYFTVTWTAAMTSGNSYFDVDVAVQWRPLGPLTSVSEIDMSTRISVW
ncbi:MAG TPA: hypothetical protein VFH51_04060 [Myxococcota bacterium]|nr:hypothetical protein [Myxococcota bacterium]